MSADLHTRDPADPEPISRVMRRRSTDKPMPVGEWIEQRNSEVDWDEALDSTWPSRELFAGRLGDSLLQPTRLTRARTHFAALWTRFQRWAR